MPPKKKNNLRKTKFIRATKNIKQIISKKPVDLNKYTNKDFIEKVKKKLTKKDLALINSKVKRHIGISSIRGSIRNKLDIDTINNLKHLMEGNEFETIKTKALNKKFYFQFRGGWFFDILINRQLRENTGPILVKMYALFINGNSGYAQVYIIEDKTEETLKTVFKEFKNDCESGNLDGVNSKYPVVMVISDAEKGAPNDGFEGIRIKKIVQAHTNHGALSRINAFASALRAWAKNQEDENKKSIRYITPDLMDEFIESWNNHIIGAVNCSRVEMMNDEDLEEAYIAYCSYHNEKINEIIPQVLKKGEDVKIIETNDEYRDNKNVYLKPKAGTYRIVDNQNGKISVVNTEDPNDVRTIAAHEIASRGRKIDLNWKDMFDMKDEDLNYNRVRRSHIKTIGQTPEQIAYNKDAAEIYRNARTVAEARIEENINRGIEKPEYRTTRAKKREVRELQEGEKNFNEMTKKKQPENPADVWKSLDEAEKKKIAEAVLKIKQDIDYDWGFLSNMTAEEYYNSMDKFLNHMDERDRNDLIGNLMIFDKKGKIKSFKSKTQNELHDRLTNYFKENPEYKEMFANDFAAKVYGKFTKNRTRQIK